jgi:tetratricopeptide (TPR) repeat protein
LDTADIIRTVASSQEIAAAPAWEELRSRLIPNGPQDRWDEGELPRAILHLDDHAVLEGCELLLRLTCVQRRSLEDARPSRAVALREVLLGLLPQTLDHPCCAVLRVLAGLEAGSAGRGRGERQRVAGDRLGPARHPATPRTVRRRVKADCWPWLLHRLIELETQDRRALDADATILLRHGAAALLGPATGTFVAPTPARAADVDPEMVARLLDLRAALVQTDSLIGPGRLLATVCEQISLIQNHVAVAAAKVRTELLMVGALYAEFAGWLFDDAGQLTAGSAWSDQALGWAHAAGCADLVSYVLMRKAQQAMLVKQAGMVILFAQAAQRNGDRASDRVLASGAQQEAHGHALAGDERAATVALARAYDMVTDAPPPDDRIQLAAHCDVSYLHAQRGSCMVRLDRPREAVGAFDEALSCWPTDYRRERGLYLARKSRALVSAGEPCEAAATGSEALDIARATGSARTLDELRDLDAALARVGTTDTEVDTFRHELAAIA